MKTWKTSRAPDCAAKRARVEHVSAIADGEVIPEMGEPEVAFFLDGFGPLNLQPTPGGSGPSAANGTWVPTGSPIPRRLATYSRPHGIRHLFAVLDLGKDGRGSRPNRASSCASRGT
ncbi:hypothetical protein PV420_09975 [Streptomyces europaeiscabiei]|nr:hypothetical protein [Streptomyces europaeiscabiei]